MRGTKRSTRTSARMRIVAIVLLAFTLVAFFAPPARADTVVYTNDFQAPVGAEWNLPTLGMTPSGRQFLGQFDNNVVTLTVPGALPAHDTATVEFDLFIIQSWDGPEHPAGPPIGPDHWMFSHDGGQHSFDATFTNVDPAEGFFFTQSYPDAFGFGSHPAYTGAAEVDTLGYTFYGDAVYRMSFTFPHSSTSLVPEFQSVNLEGIGNEGWGIDNIRVSVHETGGGGNPPVPELGTLALFSVGSLAAILAARRYF